MVVIQIEKFTKPIIQQKMPVSYHFENIPQQLKILPIWVLWKYEYNDKDKLTKPPYQVNGRKASHSNSATWNTYNAVLKTYLGRLGVYSGIGIVLSNNLVATDLDHCIKDGIIDPEALEIARLSGSYIEISPGGEGLRGIGKGTMPGGKDGRKNPDKGYEMYCNNRYVTLTGNILPEYGLLTTIKENQKGIDDTYKIMFPEKKEDKTKPIVSIDTLSMTDREIIDIASAAKNGLKFQSLYDGKWQGYFSSQSEADQSLCNMLAFYTQDFIQIDQIFKSSALYRDKWDRNDYKSTTINKAISDIKESYRGRKVPQKIDKGRGTTHLSVVASPKLESNDDPYGQYREPLDAEGFAINNSGELCFLKIEQGGGKTLVPISNFVACPTRQISKDNGISISTKFEIVGLASGGIPLPATMVPSEKFGQMQWAIDAWGLRANIKPGATSKDKMRYITQALGVNAPKDLLFGHLGWKEIDGKWAYLHAGGAINNTAAIVDLNDEGLTTYELPPSVRDAKEAMQCSLQTLNLAPRSVTMPLFSLVYLAPLCESLRKVNLEPAFLLWLNGTTGSMKSTLAALFASHFGIFSGKSLPASFKDTANSLERKAFFTKDSVLVVDDYHPNSSQSEALKMREAAERLLRGYGDRIGRGRLNADSSAKKTFVPQGLCIVTGEDLPEGGQSAASRYLGIDLERGEINLPLLTELQGKTDLLRESMRSYIESLSIEKIPNGLKQRFTQFREKATIAGQHSRVPETVAWLQIGLMAGLEHVMNVGAITELEKSKLSLEGWEIFMKLAEKHSLTIEAETPVRKYLNALSEMLTNRTLRVVEVGMGKGLDNDGFAGWEDRNWFYLLPGTVYNAVSRFYQARGGSFPLGESVILKQFEKAGIIYVEIGKQVRRTHRYTFSGERVTIIKLSKSALNESQEISTKTAVS